MKPILQLMAVTAFLLTQVASAGKVDVEHYAISADTQLPFSAAVRVGHILYLSGQIGIDPVTSRLVEGGISAETRQTLENIKASLEKYGSSMAEVVKCTVYLADINKWAAEQGIYYLFPSQFSGPQRPGNQRSGPRFTHRDRMHGYCSAGHSGFI